MSARADTWMPMYWGDYARDTGNLNACGHGAYLMLIKHYWCNGLPLVDDDDELWRIACCDSLKQWLQLRPKIVRLFVRENGVLRHKRVEHELAVAAANVAAKVKAGKAGADKRWRKDGAAEAEPSPANDAEMVLPKQTHDFANAPSPSPSPSPEGIERDTSLRSVVPRGGTHRQTDDADFDRFGAIYPRKDAKLDAQKAWKTARKLASAEEIISGLERYPFEAETRLQKLPAGWLREGRWQRELDTRPVTIATNRRGTAVDLIAELGLDLSTPLSEQFPLEELEREREQNAASKRGGVVIEARADDGRG